MIDREGRNLSAFFSFLNTLNTIQYRPFQVVYGHGMTTFEKFYNSLKYSIESNDLNDFKDLIGQVSQYKEIDSSLFDSDYFGNTQGIRSTQNNFITDLFCLTLEYSAHKLTKYLLASDLAFKIPVEHAVSLSAFMELETKQAIFADKRLYVEDHEELAIMLTRFMPQADIAHILIDNSLFDQYAQDMVLLTHLIDADLLDTIEHILKNDHKNEYKAIKLIKAEYPDLLKYFKKYDTQQMINEDF